MNTKIDYNECKIANNSKSHGELNIQLFFYVQTIFKIDA